MAENQPRLVQNARNVAPLMVRLDSASKAVLSRAAKLRQISVSDYVRQITLSQARKEINAARGRTIALTPDEEAEPLANVTSDERPYALLAGAEGDGLSAEAMAGADTRARIPMAGLVDSLNVTTAVSIALYHFSRGSLR